MREKPHFPDERPGVPRRSASQLFCFFECGERYRRKYVKMDTDGRQNMAAAVGIGCHEGAREDNAHKVAEGSAMAPAEVVDVAVAAFEDEATHKELLNDKGKPASVPEATQGKDLTAGAAAKWCSDVTQHVSPELVEVAVVVEVKQDPPVDGDGVPEEEPKVSELKGVIDCVTKAGTVRDLKTGRAKWSATRADTTIQLTTYGILVNGKLGFWPSAYVIDNLTYYKTKGWQQQTLVTSRQQADFTALMTAVDTMNRSIDAGVYPPTAAMTGHWRCSPKWCEFFTDCPYVEGYRGRLRAEETE